MRYKLTDSARADLGRLSKDGHRSFAAAAREFSTAADRIAADPTQTWPTRLRVKSVQGARGVWEMTWSFSGPDGRATWEWSTVRVDGQDHPAVRWRRVGDHRIFKNP